SIDCFNALSQRVDHFARRNFAATQQRLQIGDAYRRQLVPDHSTTFGTTKRPFAWRGALLSACSAVNQSRGASSRNTLKTGSACAAASTPVTPTWRSFSTYFSTSPSCFWKIFASSSVRLIRASLATYATSRSEF